MSGPVGGLARNAMWNWLAVGISSVVNFFLLGFALRHVTSTEYGSYVMASAAVSLMTTVSFGLSMSITRSAALEAVVSDPARRTHERVDVVDEHAAYVAICRGG